MSVGRADWQQRMVPDTAAHFHVKLYIRQHSDLEIDPLRDAQPMEAGKSIGDVIRGSHAIDQLILRFYGIIGLYAKDMKHIHTLANNVYKFSIKYFHKREVQTLTN